MKIESIWFKPSFNISFSGEELRVMIHVASNHYDGTCRRTVMEEWPDAFLLQAQKAEQKFPGVSCSYSWRDLDLLAKILTIINHGCLESEADRRLAGELYAKISGLIREHKVISAEDLKSFQIKAIRGTQNPAEAIHIIKGLNP